MNKGAETRASIVHEAMAITSVEGLDGVSIGGLAARLKMSKSGLFAHFGSKESLQQAVLETIVDHFIGDVLRPALKAPTGKHRVEKLFENWLQWDKSEHFPGGCPLLAAAFELDDQSGPLRDFIAKQQRDWLKSIARMADRAIADGEFKSSCDSRQFAFEFNAILLCFNVYKRLLKDPTARRRARHAFAKLLAAASAKK